MKKNEAIYDFSDGDLILVAISGRIHRRRPTVAVWKFLKRIHSKSTLQENELVALNRWIMGKDEEMDFENVTSTKERTITMADPLVQAIRSLKRQLTDKA